MTLLARFLFLLLLLTLGSVCCAAEPAAPLSCSFDNVTYFHRWDRQDQYEFTPKNQEDLDHWADMITINIHRNVKDENALADLANKLLGNYQAAQAVIIRTHSKPRTKDELAEHFVAVVFPQLTQTEFAFARVKLADGVGCVMVYSHRTYGGPDRDRMRAWLTANGPHLEEALMAWDGFPKPAALMALEDATQKN